MFNKSKVIQNLLVIALVCMVLTVIFGILYNHSVSNNVFEIKTQTMQDFLQAIDTSESQSPNVKIHDVNINNKNDMEQTTNETSNK